MSLRNLFRRVLGRPSQVRTAHEEVDSGSGDRPTSLERDQAEAWLAAFEAGRLNTPRDVHSPRAWDDFWENHIAVGALDQGFGDMMASDETFLGLLTRRGARTILCAGNGLSSEALALALHGFQVTALDLSAVPARVIVQMLRDPEHPAQRIPGFGIGDDHVVTVACDGPIDGDLCPPMHRSADHAPKGGGTLALVTGDLMDPNVCPGPFDVVIERRTVQLLPEHEQVSALDHLIGRLAETGLLMSHEHQGGWRLGEPRTHYAEGLIRSRGFVLRSEREGDERDLAPRLASLLFSTG